MTATVIGNGSRSAHGVVVRIGAAGSNRDDARRAAIAALADFGNEYGEKLTTDEATAELDHMTFIQVDAFRWVPMRDEDGYQGKQLDHAEPGSRGSWLGIFWSYPW